MKQKETSPFNQHCMASYMKYSMEKWSDTVESVKSLLLGQDQQKSKANFSFNFTASYMKHSMEKLVGDLL